MSEMGVHELQPFVAERNLFRAAVMRPAESTPKKGAHGGNWFPP
jgi:hypothetical protein